MPKKMYLKIITKIHFSLTTTNFFFSVNCKQILDECLYMLIHVDDKNKESLPKYFFFFKFYFNDSFFFCLFNTK